LIDSPIIRIAEERDLPAIVTIYNDVLETTFSIWSEKRASVSERRAWLIQAAALDYPVLVAEDHSGVLGFVAAGPFRPWPGYATTCEHSIHIRGDARDRGLGRRLLAALEDALRHRGIHVMVAGIDAGNRGSLRFHARAGFTEVARMPEVGFVRGSWRDLILVQKVLTPATPATGVPVPASDYPDDESTRPGGLMR
jgi:L-amino acid N-acyltransferase YncA